MRHVRPGQAPTGYERGAGGAGGTAGQTAPTPAEGIFEALIASAQESGQLLIDELAVAVDELELEPAQVDELYGKLEELHIEVVEPAEEEAEVDQREVSTEALQLFLKDIGKVDLLHRSGDRAGEADRARRPQREAGDGGGEPPPRRLDREAVPQPGAAVPRSDPGRDDRAGARGGEVRPPQGVQVLDVRDLVDPAGVARALADKARTIRMPVHVVEKLNKILRTERKLRAERGREPCSEEIAHELDLTVDEVDQIRRSAQTPVSLEKPVGDDEESSSGTSSPTSWHRSPRTSPRTSSARRRWSRSSERCPSASGRCWSSGTA